MRRRVQRAHKQHEEASLQKSSLPRQGWRLGIVGSLCCVGMYLYVVNTTAVQGYAMRGIEQEFATLQETNRRLRIEEAELKSLARVEASKERLQLSEPEQILYLEAGGPVALR